MKRWSSKVGAIAALLWAAVASAALTNLSGQVTKYDAGKSITVQDPATGGAQTLTLSSDTIFMGDVRVGATVSIQADGEQARSVTALAETPDRNPDTPALPETGNDPTGVDSGAKAPGESVDSGSPP